MIPAEKRFTAARLMLEAHQAQHVNVERFRAEKGRDPTEAEVAGIAMLTICDECDRLKRAIVDAHAEAVDHGA